MPKSKRRNVARPAPPRRPAARPAPRPAAGRPASGSRSARAPRPPRFALSGWPGAWRGWLLAWALATALILLLRLTGVFDSVPLAVFLAAVAGALAYTVHVWWGLGAPSATARFRQLLLVLLLAAIPSLMDPSTAEVNNIPRLVVLVTVATLIVGTWGIDALFGWRPRRLLTGFQWPLAGLLVWMAVTTASSLMPRVSFVGAYISYDGLILILSLAVVAGAVAETFRSEDVPDLVRLYVVGAGPVLLYGLIQLHDVYSTHHWDFTRWTTGIVTNVFSTYGNPDHFGGFLVTVLPLIVVDAAVLARGRWSRLGLWVMAAASVVLLFKSAARGAWVGELVSLVVLLAVLWPKIRRWLRVVVPLVGVALAGAVVVVTHSETFLGEPVSAIFAHASGSSVSQRYGYWTAALRAGTHHLLLGIGPDTYGSVYTRYQDAALYKTLGQGQYVNGPHNVFLAWFAGQGVPGLLLMVTFLLTVLWLGWRVWRTHLRAPGGSPNLGLVAGAIVAAAVAYLVQAAFDVDQVGTWFVFWALVGILGCLARGTWSAATLSRFPSLPRSISDQPAAASDDATLQVGWSEWSQSRSRATRRPLGRALRPGPAGPVVGGAAVLVVVVTALVFWRADALWRADHKGWAAARVHEPTPTLTAQVQTQDLRDAVSINPWEPTYDLTIGTNESRVFTEPHTSATPGILAEASSYFAAAARLDPYSGADQLAYAQTLIQQAEDDPSLVGTLKPEALSALRSAQRDNPFDTRISAAVIQARALGSTGS